MPKSKQTVLENAKKLLNANYNLKNRQQLLGKNMINRSVKTKKFPYLPLELKLAPPLW
jgi:hypothetical protein